ncbi:hypothetical protein QX776_02730 [Alteromonadaceae bacterium BrNp21-10]|nr:hypothetical protein [Alteromonadaceae bacterium BrNp21-10]
MNIEVVSTVLTSLGGATVIVTAFAHFLGKVWLDRITKQNSAKFNAELELLKTNNTIVVEDFKSKSNLVLTNNEQFALISQNTYQSFFEKRITTYQNLLNIKNNHIKEMEENFLIEEFEAWGEVYHSTYQKLRNLVIKNQLYVSNDLDNLFSDFRSKASEFMKEADMVEAYAYNSEAPVYDNEQIKAVYLKFANATHETMKSVLDQIGIDVSKVRSRVEIDKA